MPRHQLVVADMKTAQGSVRNPNIVLVLGFLFFVLSCGIESSFQSQSFTFALCGPHKMTAQQVEQTLPLLTPRLGKINPFATKYCSNF